MNEFIGWQRKHVKTCFNTFARSVPAVEFIRRGSCVAECPAQAIQLMHYTDVQMYSKAHALLESKVGSVPVKEIALMGG